jgi:AraC-like DNA-binding protein
MTPAPASFVRLSTDQFADRDRIEAAREVFGRAIMNIEIEPAPGVPFRMDMAFRALPDFGLTVGTRSAMTCVRTRQLIDSDDILVAVVRSGSGVFEFHGRETQVDAGGATVLRTGGAGRLCVHSTADMVSYRLAFDRMAPLIADLDAALVRPIPADSEALRLLVSYSGILREEDALAMPEIRSTVTAHLHDLAALAIGATRDAAAVAGSRGVRAARLRAVKADILANIAQPGLTIESVARRQGISSVYVRKLFEQSGTTFTEFILTQRLTRAHRMLGDPRFAGGTISTIAFDAGFGDLSYFNRTFRRRYGLTPSDARAKARDGEPD